MASRAYFWRLFLAYFLVLTAGVASVSIFAAYRLHAVRYEGEKRTLIEESRLIYALIHEDLRANNAAELQEKLAALQRATGARITVIAGNGAVLAETAAEPAGMENHRLRPEIIAASSQGTGESIRVSHTVGQEMLYLATRHEDPKGDAEYVRLAVPLASLTKGLHKFDAELAALAGVALVFGGGLCFWLAYRQALPVAKLSQFAAALARDELTQRAHVSDSGTVGVLNRALNQIAESLAATKLQAGERQEDLLAVLRSMSDGIIATDQQQRILLANPAAGGLLDFSAEQSTGRPLWESVRNEDLLKAVAHVLESGHEQTLRLGSARGRSIEVAVSPLIHQNRPEGLLLVIRDRTKEIQYQELRKEFVANVSHELRTPLTFIKGFIETLQDGALQDPVKGPEYLSTVEKHVSQLTNLVDDLLELSKLESKPGLPHPTRVNIGERIGKVVDLLRPAAERKSQTLSVTIAPNLPLIIGDTDYLERAISNLVDNAIKYTPANGKIAVEATCSGGIVIVTVTDNGIGIPPEDQPRIFERFYRVDKSRSREMGGTGLGLAIVKHVAIAHGGAVEVQSELGNGSVFRLVLRA